MAVNPFKPTAGADPPLLVGRDDILDQFDESIENGPGAPMRLSMFTGPRGIGKTVMLNAVAERVQERYQWLVIHETARPGFLGRLNRTILKHLDKTHHRSLTGISLPTILGTGGGGFQLSAPAAPETVDLREALGALLDQCETNGTGLLITLDEIHSDNSTELGELAAAAQHLIREKREIAIAFAGLPNAVDDLLSANQITFLRRADRHHLKDVPLTDVADALHSTITESGHTIDPEALDLATQATGGYPFMIQLVGYHIWRKAIGDHITTDAASAGIEQARTRLGSLVHAPALRELSDVDRTYLLAMAQDPGPSSTGEIARRMEKDPRYASVYRKRLIAAGMITTDTRGKVDYTMPYLRDYLLEHAANLIPPSKGPS